MNCRLPSPRLREVIRQGRVANGLVLSALLCVAATGCARDAVGPSDAAALGPAFSTLAGTPTCPTSPDFVVSTETDLRSAVLTAPPGSTIAISGMIALSTGPILIQRSDLHLTCAAPGAGLEVLPGSPTQRLIRIEFPRVSVTGLRLDGHLITLENSSTVVARSVGQIAEDVTLADNDITCGTRPCVTLNGTPRAMIARNRMVPAAESGRPPYTFYAQSGSTVAEDVTLTDNDMTCGAYACAYLTGTPRAMIARNRMAPAVGVTTGAAVIVESPVGGATAEDVILADNIMTCGASNCVWLTGTPRAVIARNQMTHMEGVAGGGSMVVVKSVVNGATADSVTLADNTIACGPMSCAYFNETPHAMIVRNRMAPQDGDDAYSMVSVGSTERITSEDVTVSDNDLTCGNSSCISLNGTPRAVIVRNRMTPSTGIAPTNTLIVQRYVETGTGREVGAEDVTASDNDITCGSGSCVFFIGTPRAVIVRNRLAASSTISGIHVQGSGGVTDGTRVEQNTVTTTGASTSNAGGLFGGIRVRDGKEIVVTDNIVTGPWANSIFVTAVLGGEVARNNLRGAYQYGIALAISPTSGPLSVDGLVVRNNRITDAILAGIGVRYTCRSMFVGNNLTGNARGAEFFPESGANTLLGNGTIVFDNGAMDCSGDGNPDPNMISGAKRVQKGPPIGPVIGSAVSGAVSDMR